MRLPPVAVLLPRNHVLLIFAAFTAPFCYLKIGLAGCKTLASTRLNPYVQHRVEGSAGRRLPVEEQPCVPPVGSPYEI